MASLDDAVDFEVTTSANELKAVLKPAPTPVGAKKLHEDHKVLKTVAEPEPTPVDQESESTLAPHEDHKVLKKVAEPEPISVDDESETTLAQNEDHKVLKTFAEREPSPVDDESETTPAAHEDHKVLKSVAELEPASEIAEPEVTLAPHEESLSSCSRHPKCAGLTGNCCPHDGEMLSCCDLTLLGDHGPEKNDSASGIDQVMQATEDLRRQVDALMRDRTAEKAPRSSDDEFQPSPPSSQRASTSPQQEPQQFSPQPLGQTQPIYQQDPQYDPQQQYQAQYMDPSSGSALFQRQPPQYAWNPAQPMPPPTQWQLQDYPTESSGQFETQYMEQASALPPFQGQSPQYTWNQAQYAQMLPGQPQNPYDSSAFQRR